ncbi:molybdopterin converting factor subunit 1 [Pseudoduganella eburnea]|uniref:Molybdopterin converting factor subunit 1 n=1 Tax=Massilia eburnea TaxID=1776165 RepID=A0A6L6QKH2_9BURK|nr:molybdopterin converting factor subunit 1 [Massilia eburnea]MTW12685.1 molybdopterin converting factor subunit 1 [Massilia eburnea]
MLINLKYFASVRESLGGGEQAALPAGVETVGQVRAWLQSRGEPWASTLAQGRALRMACNQRMCDASAPVADGDEIAFFPPVTGG